MGESILEKRIFNIRSYANVLWTSVSQLDRDVKIHAKLHWVMQYDVEIAIKFIDVPPNNLEIKKHTMRTFFTTA